MKIYIVHGSSGEYDSYREWVVAVFEQEKDAVELIQELEKWFKTEECFTKGCLYDSLATIPSLKADVPRYLYTIWETYKTFKDYKSMLRIPETNQELPIRERKIKLRERQDGRTLLDIALCLHGINTGSSESFDSDRIRRESIEILQEALVCWTPGLGGSEKFDNAVKNLIEVVLEEPCWIK